MSGLALAQAPPPTRPLRWLLASPLWGLVAGVWLLLHGETAVLDRWSPHAVVLVHLFTLGVLGNAMLGSLLQFLPVAADSVLPWAPAAGALHLLFNLGLALFVPAFAGSRTEWLPVASALLALPLIGFAAATLPVLVRRGAQGVLRAGIAFALAMLVLTVLAALLLVAALRGALVVPLERLTDLHALSGLLGWVVALMAAVGSITLPMFQGTAPVPPRWLSRWLQLTATGLLAGGVLSFALDDQAVLVFATAPSLLAFVGVSLGLPWRRRHARNPVLTAFWRSGTLALAGAGLTAMAVALELLPARAGLLAGMLGIGIGLPLMLTGMMLEITGFLCWIDLRRRCPRGQRIPGTGSLLEERDKRLALYAHLLCAAALVAAAIWPALARPAGIGLLLAHAGTLACILAGLWRARVFLRHAAVGAHGESS